MEVVQRGAYDLFHKPFDIDEVEIIVRRAAQHYRLEQDNLNLRDQLRKAAGRKHSRFKPCSATIIDQARAVAETSATVLITGESGTGKEMLARLIHNISPRARAPFIACDLRLCPRAWSNRSFLVTKKARSPEPIRRQGRFELADSGTLFLDEIGEMTPACRWNCCACAGERVRAIGRETGYHGRYSRHCGDQSQSGTDGRADQFRADLYYRLNIVNLELPPLRERPDDIPILATHFARKPRQA